jgi:TPR repeat protein
MRGRPRTSLSLIAMICKAKVLFFAADPLSAPPDGRNPRLMLDEDVRTIRQRVRAATHRDALQFDWRFAARPTDVVQALRESPAEVVHFSGHGGTEGLVLVGPGGDPQPVSAAALEQLFQVFKGKIRVVVLNACLSLPQAEAIAEVVGCAIGTRRPISDAAAITFGASFYSAIAFGRSVKVAFDQAVAELGMAHPGEEDCPQLVVRKGVDPARLVLVRPCAWRVAGAAAGAVLAGAAVFVAMKEVDPPPVSLAGQPDCGWDGGGGAPRTLVSGTGEQAPPPTAGAVASDLETAKVLHGDRKYADAFPLFRRAAEAGNPEAMVFLGLAYLRGQGTTPNPDSAFRWLHDAAVKRDPRGMTELGWLYENGLGVRRSIYLAEHWYLAAANQNGWAEAMRKLASLYRDKGNYEGAFRLYRDAVLAGSLDARVDAGWMYETGKGRASPDVEEALCLYRTAAEAGSASGMLAMGRAYQDGVGVTRDLAKAKEWYRKAADAGSAEAMNAMGRLYQNGWGVTRDRMEAIRWYRMAKDAGSRLAAGNLILLGVN